jgi:enamine deaminase RidA (YjgF/YER057c/UK114 family)
MTTTLLNPRDVHTPAGPYSHTAVVPKGAQLVFLAGQVGMRPDGSIADGFAEQAEVTFENVRACLAAHGLGFEAVVRLGVFVLPGQDLEVVRAVREKRFGTHRPTSTTVYVPQLASSAYLLEVEAIAVASPPKSRRGGARAAPRARASGKRTRKRRT